MRIKADLYSGGLFEYWEPKARPLDATGHQPSHHRLNHRWLGASLRVSCSIRAPWFVEESSTVNALPLSLLRMVID